MGDVGGDREAQPAAAGVAAVSVGQAGEAFEDAFPVLWRDAVTVVDDAHHGLTGHALCGDLDVRVRMSLRVVQEVGQPPDQLHPVTVDIDVWGRIGDARYALGPGFGLPPHQLTEID